MYVRIIRHNVYIRVKKRGIANEFRQIVQKFIVVYEMVFLRIAITIITPSKFLRVFDVTGSCCIHLQNSHKL